MRFAQQLQGLTLDYFHSSYLLTSSRFVWQFLELLWWSLRRQGVLRMLYCEVHSMGRLQRRFMLFKALSCYVWFFLTYYTLSTGLRLYCRHLEAQTWYLDRYWCLSSPVGSCLSISITCLPAYVVSVTEMAHNLLSMRTGLWGKAYPAVGANQWANPEED
jgi:hypothetical protein